MHRAKRKTAVICALVLPLLLSSCHGKAVRQLRVVPTPLFEGIYYFGVQRENGVLQCAIENAVTGWRDDGTLDELRRRYIGGDGGTPVTESGDGLPLTVAFCGTRRPLFVHTDSGLCGIEPELAARLARQLGRSLRILECNAIEAQKAVIAGQADVVLGELSREELEFSGLQAVAPYYDADVLLVTAEEETTYDFCRTGERLRTALEQVDHTVRIGIVSTDEMRFFSDDDGLWTHGQLAATVQSFPTAEAAVRGVADGTVSYALIDRAAVFTVDAVNRENGYTDS